MQNTRRAAIAGKVKDASAEFGVVLEEDTGGAAQVLAGGEAGVMVEKTGAGNACLRVNSVEFRGAGGVLPGWLVVSGWAGNPGKEEGFGLKCNHRTKLTAECLSVCVRYRRNPRAL